jgi:hypothetical protein
MEVTTKSAAVAQRSLVSLRRRHKLRTDLDNR